jgi:hypothetical protein
VMCRVQCEKTVDSGKRRCILWPCQGQNGNPGLMSCRLLPYMDSVPISRKISNGGMETTCEPSGAGPRSMPPSVEKQQGQPLARTRAGVRGIPSVDGGLSLRLADKLYVKPL